jgi:tRNA-binding EMAP/Myf-like protein
MDSDQNQDVVIEGEELIEYINQETKIEIEAVSEILDKEMEFLESKGLVLENKPDDAEEREVVFIDEDELISYISGRTNLSKKVVKFVLDTEDEYLDSLGLREENLD